MMLKSSRFWFFWVPLIALALLLVQELTNTPEQMAVLMSETGLVEFLQWIIITAATILFILMLRHVKVQETPRLFAWIVLGILGCLYTSGEEASWGQHFIHWNTPEYWQALNDQQETNLHNTSSWLDQKPRLILLIGILFGGIVFPLLQKFKPGFLPQKYAIIYPPSDMMFLAAMTELPTLANKLLKLGGIHLFERVSEVQELYMFSFVLMYAVILYRRILQK